jgi:dihydrofolate reductase
MSRIISTHWISLDGFISGPAGELDFVRGDGQLAEYEIGLVSTMGHLLFGRKTYEQLSFYWSQIPDNPAAADWEKVYAGKLNPMRKSVVSTSLQTASWADSDILRDAESVADLRARATGDILTRPHRRIPSARASGASGRRDIALRIARQPPQSEKDPRRNLRQQPRAQRLSNRTRERLS